MIFRYSALASCSICSSFAVISQFLALGFTDINRLNRVREDFREDFTDVDIKPPNLQHLSHPSHPPPPLHPHSPHPPQASHPLNHLPHGASHTSPHLNASLSPHPAPYSIATTSTMNSEYDMHFLGVDIVNSMRIFTRD